MNTSTTSADTPIEGNVPPVVRTTVERVIIDATEGGPAATDISPLTVDTPPGGATFTSAADGNENNTSAARSLCYPSTIRTNPLLSDELFEQGYDSDGQLPLIKDIFLEMEELDIYNDVQVGIEDSVADAGQEPPPDNDRNIDLGGFILISGDNMKKILVDGLRKELKARGLSTNGRNAELVARLKKQWRTRFLL